ncbi:MAG: penicillin acylase family protein [Gemmatimonadetes bacterium]|nr:penicillin acylase family protein [Gemmatimonadota bacterium]
MVRGAPGRPRKARRVRGDDPGSPGIVIGFTRDVAWSLTNTGADVLDFYRETVDDQVHPTKYLVDDTWKELERREELYRDKSGSVLRVDTVRFTHRGPLQRLNKEWVSMRWTVNEPSDLVSAFYHASHATTAAEFLDVFARDYFAPAQNVIVADRAGPSRSAPPGTIRCARRGATGSRSSMARRRPATGPATGRSRSIRRR